MNILVCNTKEFWFDSIGSDRPQISKNQPTVTVVRLLLCHNNTAYGIEESGGRHQVSAQTQHLFPNPYPLSFSIQGKTNNNKTWFPHLPWAKCVWLYDKFELTYIQKYSEKMPSIYFMIKHSRKKFVHIVPSPFLFSMCMCFQKYNSHLVIIRWKTNMLPRAQWKVKKSRSLMVLSHSTNSAMPNSRL